MITDRIRIIINESREQELIMENLGALRAYPQAMVKQLLTRRIDIGPGSKLVIKMFKSASAAERAVKENSRMTFALVPPGSPAIAILTPVPGGYSSKTAYTIIKNHDIRLPYDKTSLGQVGDALLRGQLTDVFTLFNSMNKAYGKNWELHEIQVDSSRVELRQARAESKKNVDAFARKDHGRAPYGNWSKKDLMDRLDAYKTGKSPNVKSAADILQLIASSGSKLPTKFKFNGLNFDLGSSKIQFDERKGTLYGGMGGDNGLEYRADWNEYYQALKGVPDENAKDLAQTLPKYIFVEYKLNGGVVGPASVKFKS